MARIAVIDYELCKPSKCHRECIAFCPVNLTGGKAIEFDEARRKPVIYEETCVGCGICVKKCPFKAISIVNLPDELEKSVIHRYGRNGFKLYGLPVPREGRILGIIGKNGTGKSTALRILSGELRPNLGQVDGTTPSWDEVIRRFRGTELQNYFKKLAEGSIKAAHKIQYIDLVPRRVKGTVRQLLEKADERGIWRELVKELGLEKVLDRDIRQLSGGELQRFMVAAVLSKDATLYLFDEPSSYLDVRERVRVARTIRSYAPNNSYLVVVEHDIAMLDYLSDYVVIMYGEPGVYGIASKPYGVRAGINHFLRGYLPAENMRIRSEPIRYTITATPSETTLSLKTYISWSKLTVSLNGFQLRVEEGELHEGEVLGVVGPNGIGKTTFVRVLAGELKPTEGSVSKPAGTLKVSYKPQYVSPSLFGEDKTVEEVLAEANKSVLAPGSWLNVEILRRMRLDRLLDRRVGELSGGELQKLAVAVALAREADIYLLDEPSAYLDVEERLAVAKIIKRLTEARGAAAIVVEHDIAVQDYIASRIMVFTGTPGVEGHAHQPASLFDGMNTFLKELGITIRKDPETGRPRINKEGSFLDRLQKRLGKYYYIPRPGEEEKEGEE
ncbi:ribosome biogenesis/translation initiation ATPase RLI [Hyperthermus butylicus]|uniref:RNase L inhibitor, ATPase n=1 Tax=Hyperthermus butylicus (strain DSM 5456 / JCM 9403 / PLM1-5) TaxID=415426 RepID=A2BK36_HYPBU|nr:ribosome biogenesis/translation initiation ATPase RLI [Hyperthermus butylicus]ABM80347.1 RNase L inhibitor, ATPase [Hyperthermus butylicus DSM 5456]